MPRIIGIFEDQRAADEVIEQLELNGIDRTTMLCASSQTGELAVRSQAVAQEGMYPRDRGRKIPNHFVNVH